jgi:Rrf2 family protein
MYFNSKATHGLRAVAIIAASPGGLPVTALDLARELQVSLSWMECIASKLRKGGLIVAHRGPGGGYQLQGLIENFSVWDVVSHFHASDLPPKNACRGLESQAVLGLAIEAEQAMRRHLEAWPLVDIVSKLSPSKIAFTDGAQRRSAFNLKPLLQPRPPMAPSWVFDLAKFSRTAYAQEIA